MWSNDGHEKFSSLGLLWLLGKEKMTKIWAILSILSNQEFRQWRMRDEKTHFLAFAILVVVAFALSACGQTEATEETVAGFQIPAPEEGKYNVALSMLAARWWRLVTIAWCWPDVCGRECRWCSYAYIKTCRKVQMPNRWSAHCS